MPEGHTVHRLARTFTSLFVGEVITVTSPQGRFAHGAALLDGLVLVQAEAFGKQMFLGFGESTHVGQEDLLWLRVHLGLYGSWTFTGDGTVRVAHAIGAPRKRIGERELVMSDGTQETFVTEVNDAWEPPEPRGQVRARFIGEHAVADLTGPTACEVLTWDETRIAAGKLGPDPIRPDADAEKFISKVAKSRTAIGALLMNQAVIAGVGNIYRAEVLFRHNVSPFMPGSSVPRETVRAMWDDLVVLMEYGVTYGAIVTTEPEDRLKGVDLSGVMENRAITRQNTDDEPGAVPREQSFYVYHRQGQPCRICGEPISLGEMQARKLYWCPRCQK
ncbi:Fpg/Nei family DNA glycosylase [Timonella sp. A28]|uniref:Fpg/Nei family DNA glycosylase n=1 Tax=Timonella sp. A28 TaxID=3442640 RepID=UPI003EBCE527